MQAHALNTMVGAIKEHSTEIVALLNDRRTAPEYFEWLRWVTGFFEEYVERPLFDLVLEAVQQGAYDGAEHMLWLTSHDLAKHQPIWAIELLEARLIDHGDALALNADGKVAVLGLREYGASELVRKAAAAKPLVFVRTIVPYLQQVMAATAMDYPEGYPVADRHFSVRFELEEMDDGELEDALLTASVRSLETLAQNDPAAISSLLRLP